MTQPPAPVRDPRLVALIGVVAISFSGVYVALSGVSASTSAFFRAAYALPALLAVWWTTRGQDARTPRQRWIAVGAGLALGIDLTLWHHSIPLIGVGMATVLANLQVVLVGLAAWVMLGERPSRAQLLAVPVALAGVALTSGLGQVGAYGVDPVLGTLLALGAAVFYTGFLLIFREANRTQGPTAGPLLDATLGTAAATLTLGVLTDPNLTLSPSWPAHGWLLLLGVAAHTLGWLTIAHALPRLPALTTSVLLLLQPTLAMVWGVVIFSEAPSLLQWLGVVLVLVGVGWASLGGRDPGEDTAPGALEVPAT